MAEFSDWLKAKGISWPENLWAGTSVTAQRFKFRVNDLRKVGDENTIRFLSVEPQWDEISLAKNLHGIHWVIQGGESGSDPHNFELNWARKLRDECRAAGVPYFLKQMGEKASDGGVMVNFKDRHGGEWDEWPTDLKVREMPKPNPAQIAYLNSLKPVTHIPTTPSSVLVAKAPAVTAGSPVVMARPAGMKPQEWAWHKDNPNGVRRAKDKAAEVLEGGSYP